MKFPRLTQGRQWLSYLRTSDRIPTIENLRMMRVIVLRMKPNRPLINDGINIGKLFRMGEQTNGHTYGPLQEAAKEGNCLFDRAGDV